MFGYIVTHRQELKVREDEAYQAAYCGLCRSLKKRHGRPGQMTLSYDMTFIVVLLTSLYESALKESIRRCKTHPIKKQQMLQSEITEYAADMNVILTWYHLKDDWQDERKPGSLLGLHVLGRKAKKAAGTYPRQCRVMHRELKALAGNLNVTRCGLGSGWLLSAEAAAWVQLGWRKVLSGLPFGCLPGHIYGRSVYAALQRQLPGSLIVGVDYDASIREITVQSRVRMLIDCELE